MAIILAIGAALGWGIADFIGGLKSRSMPLLAVLLISQAAALALLFAIVLSLGEPVPDRRFVAYAVLAGLSELVGVAALYRGLSIGVMSIVAPVAAIAPAVPLVVGMMLGEIPRPMQGLGLVLILIGLVLTSRQRQDSQQAAVRNLLPSILYGLLSAIGFGIFFTALDAASEGNIPWALLIARFTAVCAIAASVILVRARLATVSRTDVPAAVAIGLLIVAADFLYATATTLGILSVVAVIGALHTVITVAMARICLRERVERLQNWGMAACLCGVLVVTAW